MSYSPVPLINGLIIDTQEYLTSQKITVTKEETADWGSINKDILNKFDTI